MWRYAYWCDDMHINILKKKMLEKCNQKGDEKNWNEIGEKKKLNENGDRKHVVFATFLKWREKTCWCDNMYT